MVIVTLLSAALLLLVVPVPLTKAAYPIKLEVVNSFTTPNSLIYDTEVAYRGILIGAMRRLEKSNGDFKFTYSDDPNYGPFLVSVNGVAGNYAKDQTYWKLLVQAQNGTMIAADVGIGCYIPRPNEHITLEFTKG